MEAFFSHANQFTGPKAPAQSASAVPRQPGFSMIDLSGGVCGRSCIRGYFSDGNRPVVPVACPVVLRRFGMQAGVGPAAASHGPPPFDTARLNIPGLGSFEIAQAGKCSSDRTGPPTDHCICATFPFAGVSAGDGAALAVAVTDCGPSVDVVGRPGDPVPGDRAASAGDRCMTRRGHRSTRTIRRSASCALGRSESHVIRRKWALISS